MTIKKNGWAYWRCKKDLKVLLTADVLHLLSDPTANGALSTGVNRPEHLDALRSDHLQQTL